MLLPDMETKAVFSVLILNTYLEENKLISEDSEYYKLRFKWENRAVKVNE